MNFFEAIILGIVQGLTEFLPVSSSGHLELGKHFFGINPEANFYFSVAVHGATVLSTILVFRKDILSLFQGLFRFTFNDETKYTVRLVISMIPVGIAGIYTKEITDYFFDGNMVSLGVQFLITAAIIGLTLFLKPKDRPISYLDSFIIGIAQAIAVIPAVSRSGATIATGMMLGNKRADLAKFSFLMVLVPVVGANMLEAMSGDFSSEGTQISVIIAGFIAAFVSGYFACKWMINLVKKGNLGWFSVYCILLGILSILLGLHVI
jgi:undecaprenyl-diphosphatase